MNTAISHLPVLVRYNAICLALADQGGDQFFGEPSLNILDFIQTDTQWSWLYQPIFAADKLMNTPKALCNILALDALRII